MSPTSHKRSSYQKVNRRGFLRANSHALAGVAIAGSASRAGAVGNSGKNLAPTVNYGPPAGIAKLDSNENPFGPSPQAMAAMVNAAKSGAYYVEDSVIRLKAMIAERHGVTPEHISLSAGSSGVLSNLSVAMTKKGHMLVPDLFWDTTAKAGVRQGW